MKSQEPLMEAFKGIKEYCHPEDAELLQKLNVQDSEETEKKLEEQERQSNSNRKLVHNLKSGIGKKVKHSLAATSVAIGLAFSAVPALLLLPICLIPVTIATIIGIAGFFFWMVVEERNGDFLDYALEQVISLAIPVVVAGICFSPAIAIATPMIIAGAAIQFVPNMISKHIKKPVEF